MRDQLTDEMLTQAAKQVAESMKASLPVPEECHHEFPPEFERDIKRLAAQTERKRHIRRYLQRVAAACLAVVISLSTWLAVDAEARAAFVQWVKTVYEQSVVYEFFHSGDTQADVSYNLGWLPAGYSIFATESAGSIHTVMYQNNEGSSILLVYQTGFDSQTEVFVGENEAESVVINGCQGEFFTDKSSMESNELIFFDAEAKVLFAISSYLDKDTMIEIAENIIAVSE